MKPKTPPSTAPSTALVGPPPVRINAAEKRIQVIEMRKLGYSHREIGKALGMSGQAAQKHEVKALAELALRQDKVTAGYRALQMARLEDEYKEVHALGKHKDANVANRLAAVGLRLQINDRMSRLMGTDAPIRIESKSEVVQNMTQEQQNRIAQRVLAAREANVIDINPEEE